MDNDIKQKYSEEDFNEETIAAMQEAKKIADDPNVPSYSSIEELNEALMKD